MSKFEKKIICKGQKFEKKIICKGQETFEYRMQTKTWDLEKREIVNVFFMTSFERRNKIISNDFCFLFFLPWQNSTKKFNQYFPLNGNEIGMCDTVSFTELDRCLWAGYSSSILITFEASYNYKLQAKTYNRSIIGKFSLPKLMKHSVG